MGTPHTWGPLIPGDPSYLGTPHTWEPLIPGDPSYLGTPHTWRPLIPGDPSYLGTLHTWGPLKPGNPSYLGTPSTWGKDDTLPCKCQALAWKNEPKAWIQGFQALKFFFGCIVFLLLYIS